MAKARAMIFVCGTLLLSLTAMEQDALAEAVKTEGDLKVTGTLDNTGGNGIKFPDGSTQTQACTGCAGGILSINLGGTGGNTATAARTNLGVPALNTTNAFNGDQAVNGNLTATGSVSGSGFKIGSDLFAYGSSANANVFLGFGAGNTTMTGTINTAVGGGALHDNTTGNYNTVIGHNALTLTNSGSFNVALGDSALFSNQTGSDNAATGMQALFFNNSGSYNTAMGSLALFNNNSGSSNTAVGYQSGVTTTPGNTNLTGSSNTFIGYNSGPGTSTQLNNATAIGANAVVSASNSLVLGSINGVNGATSSAKVGIGTSAPNVTLHVIDNSTGTGIRGESAYANGNGVIGVADNGANAYGVWGSSASGYAGYFSGKAAVTGCLTAGGTPLGGACSSDERLKTDIRPLSPSLESLAALLPVSFKWRSENPAGYRFDSKTAIGLVAQQVEELFPDMVSTDKNGYMQVDYGRLPLMLLAGMKELKERNDCLNVQLREQQGQIEDLNRKIQQLQEAQVRLAATVERLASAQGQTKVASSAAMDITSATH